MPIENWIFRNGHPVCDDYRRLFIVMTSTLEQGILVLVAFASAAELCPENQYTGHIEYELSILNSGCADAAEILILVKWEDDYWKSEFITFVEEYF